MRSFIGNNKQSKTVENTSTAESKPNYAPSAQNHNPVPKPPAHAGLKTPATATIGPKITIHGEVLGEENIIIHGRVEGSILLREHMVTVGKQGVVKANIVAKVIDIEGKVQGDLFGEQQIIVRSSSHVRGNLVAERVTLEDGAKLYGSIDMDTESHKPPPSVELSQSTELLAEKTAKKAPARQLEPLTME